MLKKLYLLLLLTVVTMYSQTGAHTTTSLVSNIFISKDETKFLSLSGTEIVLWDNTSNKMIWVKKLADIGLGNSILYDPIVKVDPFMKYMLISDKSTFKCLVNLNTFEVTRWNYDIHGFVNDGRVAVIDYVFNNKKNSHKAYLLNLDNGEKELIADKMNKIYVYEHLDIIQIIYNRKTPYDYDYDKTKEFDVSTKSLTDKSKDRNYHLKFESNSVKCSSQDKTIQITDKSGKELALFNLKNSTKGIGVSNLFYVSGNKSHAYVLEHYKNTTNERISYLCVYDLTNGDVVKKIELHDTSDSAKLIARAETKKQNQIDDEKQRQFNSPENVLKRRLSSLQGNAYYNTNTKGIYYVVPDKPLYQGDLVRMDALNDDPKLKMEVYEKIETLENPTIYKKIISRKSCTHCNGKGFISNSYTRTAADYEYTTGKKLVETTTHTNSCGNCGGCGLVPNF